MDIYKHRQVFMEQLKNANGILSLTEAGNNPIEIDNNSADLNWPDKPADRPVTISASWVGYDYAKTLGVPLVKGRDFSTEFLDSANYIINESAARMMELNDPVGTKVSFWNGDGKIIGVMKDFHLHSLHKPITPLILCLMPGNSDLLLIRTEAGKTEEAIASLKKVYNDLESPFPLEYNFMDEAYAKRYQSEQVIGKLVNIFAIVAIAISCLGLFGLATFTTEQRTKEIGIRKALGASITSIIQLLSKEYLMLVSIAFVVVCPGAYYVVHAWLENFAYHATIDVWIFAITGIMAVATALLTISVQTIRAASANPTQSLRSE